MARRNDDRPSNGSGAQRQLPLHAVVLRRIRCVVLAHHVQVLDARQVQRSYPAVQALSQSRNVVIQVRELGLIQQDCLVAQVHVRRRAHIRFGNFGVRALEDAMTKQYNDPYITYRERAEALALYIALTQRYVRS